MSLKILLADDSLTAQNMGKKILADAGYEVIAVSNGAQAMKKIASDKPDLVVLDVYMPGYTGVEVCERMRNSRETARIPVVLSVGKMEAFRPEEGTRARADGLIVKPFEATELLAVVKKLAETLSPAPRSKRQPEPESVLETAEPMTGAIDPQLESQPASVEVPQEVAATPVIGMELIPEEAQEPPAPSAATPIEFEVEREPAPVKIDPRSHMSSAAGLSGVFEIEPAPTPAVATSPEPAPRDEFERFEAATDTQTQQADTSAADASTATVEHEFDVAAPPELASSEFTSHTESTTETWSAPPVESAQSEDTVERFDQVQPEAGIESPATARPQGLPELATWDAPASASPVETPQWSANPPHNDSAAEVQAAGSVWVAEEIEVAPYEVAVSLHRQMQQEAREAPEAQVAASPAVSAIAEPFPAEPYQPSAENSAFDENFLPEPGPSVLADPFDQSEPRSASSDIANSDPDPSLGSPPPGEAQPIAEPAPALQLEQDAASQLAPQISAPTVNESPVDPARVAAIVDQALERLRPELIAAVTRELERKA